MLLGERGVMSLKKYSLNWTNFMVHQLLAPSTFAPLQINCQTKKVLLHKKYILSIIIYRCV